MRYTDTDHPFDTDNCGWRRFTQVLGEHFDIVDWADDDGRPVLTTLVDLSSGDTFTVADLDSVEVREPYTLLAFTVGGELAAHGRFDGDPAAESYAPRLAMTEAAMAATRPVALHDPGQLDMPDGSWFAIPAHPACATVATIGDARAAVLVLLDRYRGLLSAVGPFPGHVAAHAWRPAPDVDPGVERLIVALRPATTRPDTA
jgi:hypothetical protein